MLDGCDSIELLVFGILKTPFETLVLTTQLETSYDQAALLKTDNVCLADVYYATLRIYHA